jgi:membrane fusion protein (multidrug efflux system)
LGIAATCSPFLISCTAKKIPVEQPALRVATVLASTGEIYPRETLAGIIAPTLSVGLQSTLNEPANRLYAKEGAYVHRGQMLALLDTADLQAALDADSATAASNKAATLHAGYAGSLAIDQGLDASRSAHAAVLQAEVGLERDRADLARYRTLSANGYIAQQQVDQQQTVVRSDEQALRAAQAAWSAARSNVAANGTATGPGLQSSAIAQSLALEAAALAQARQKRIEISKARIVSPIDGVVVNRNLNPGEYPGMRQIFTIQQVDPIYAVLHGSGAQIANIAASAPALIQVDDTARRTFNGKVVAVLNQIAPGSTNFEVKVQLSNHDLALRPGMTAQGTIMLPTRRGVRVPATAFTDDTHTSVMTVDAYGTVHAAHVVEGGNDGGTAIVTGLTAGTRVISDGQAGAREQ